MNASLTGIIGVVGFVLSLIGVGYAIAGIIKVEQRKQFLLRGLAFNTLYLCLGLLVPVLEHYKIF